MNASSKARSGKRRILLGVSGSVAAYKSVLLARLLVKSGYDVDVVLTEAAEKFVGRATFLGLGLRVHTSMWTDSPGELHVELAKSVDAILVAPATADTLSALASGRAHDLLTATVLCSNRPLLLAPAMHPAMWKNPATAHSVLLLEERGARFLGPVHGPVASGDEGEGRFEEPENIAIALDLSLRGHAPLAGRRLVVTAGPTQEALDPVRVLSNQSSGKMGFALAERAAFLGATVELVTGPVALAPPPLVRVTKVQSALEMLEAVTRLLGPGMQDADALVMAAAVGDYRPRTPSTEKIKKSSNGSLTLELVENPDILATVGHARTSRTPILVGFALETAEGDALIQLARRKLIQKRADLIVANSASESLGRDDSRVLLVSPQDCRKLDFAPKRVIATQILEWLAERLDAPEPSEFSA